MLYIHIFFWYHKIELCDKKKCKRIFRLMILIDTHTHYYIVLYNHILYIIAHRYTIWILWDESNIIMKRRKENFPFLFFRWTMVSFFFFTYFHFKNTSHDFIMYASRFKTIHYCCLKGFLRYILNIYIWIVIKKKNAYLQVE